MAPVAPLGKARLIQMLEAGAPLPIYFGSPHPNMAVLEDKGWFFLRELVVDPADSKAAFEEAMRTGRNFMPENHYALGLPTGHIYLEASTREGLVKRLKAFDWPKSW